MNPTSFKLKEKVRSLTTNCLYISRFITITTSYSLIQTNFYHWLDFCHDLQEQNQLAVLVVAAVVVVVAVVAVVVSVEVSSFEKYNVNVTSCSSDRNNEMFSMFRRISARRSTWRRRRWRRLPRPRSWRRRWRRVPWSRLWRWIPWRTRPRLLIFKIRKCCFFFRVLCHFLCGNPNDHRCFFFCWLFAKKHTT